MLSLLPKLKAGMAKRRRSSADDGDGGGAPLEPPDKPSDALRLLTLNLAHGRSRSAHQALLKRATVEANLARVAEVLATTAPDVVALQEADGPSVWSGNFDHIETLIESTDLAEGFRGEHNEFRLGPYELRSGTALLAREPFAGTHSQRFGLNWRDTKGFVAATVIVPAWNGMEVDAASVHLDFLRPKIRTRQVEHLADTLADRPTTRPLVVSGDMNCCWELERGPLEYLAERLDLELYRPEDADCPTFPSSNPMRRLDWILISKHLEFVHHETLAVPLSDHLGVLADVRPR